MIFLETPANPTMTLTDIAAMAEVAHRHGALCMVDNTLLGPLYQQPLAHGADLVVYSATKYLGGHSDLVAGAALGSGELDRAGQALPDDSRHHARPALGLAADALARDRQAAHDLRAQERRARRRAGWRKHPQVARVHFPAR